MAVSGNANRRRQRNSAALKAFGANAQNGRKPVLCREIRHGESPVCIYTVGYERRDGDQLIDALQNLNIEHLADVRDRPISRKPDFRAAALCARCEAAEIEYWSWTELGSTERQRERLRETGDIRYFHKVFRQYATRSLTEDIDRLASIAARKSVALLCYEREHDECHRRTIADLLADRLDASVIAIL